MDLATYKPDYQQAIHRWEAYFQGDLVDRPPVVVTSPKNCESFPRPIAYHEKVFTDIDIVLDHAQTIIEATYWGGEAFPSFYPSFGPDEIAVFCGAELLWSSDSPDTNWSVPFVDTWERAFPIRLQYNNGLYQRLLELYRRAVHRFGGSVLLVAPDLHTNMDLLAAIRGPQKLCFDLIDQPVLVDQAMQYSRLVFKELWTAINRAGRMPDHGYCLESHGFFSLMGAATLQCDFSIMMSPDMFRRWVLPALDEEAELVGQVVYHWDGLAALVHMKDLLAMKRIHTLSFVPGDGHGSLVDHVDLLRDLQEAGKAVHVWGSPEECQQMHRTLRPDRVFYCTQATSQSEAEALLEWFDKNT